MSPDRATAADPVAARRRARRAFWLLLVLAVLLVGALDAMLRADAGPLTGTAVAVLGVLTAVTIALAARVLLALSR
ncbi:hypothetical protein [Myceligenerans indicum]|uniref:Uncharacterized protein n=1 Tax=Myceligenerans indicum TaxID=2593663 RepID=A0ABS1LIW1_9MICO|nr:hypothetical protein [Myceligenerans indicum]MBL0886180.1 hypothetical protein [Myceligenerans indicum]